MFTYSSQWSTFFTPAPGGGAFGSPPRPAPAPQQPSLFATTEGRVQLFACHLPPDWRQPFTEEFMRILRQRQRGGYLRLAPRKIPLSRERFGGYGEALRPLDTKDVDDLLHQQAEEGLRMLEIPEDELCRSRRCSDLAWQAARLGQLVAELAQPRRRVDAWQALCQALFALPGARVMAERRA